MPLVGGVVIVGVVVLLVGSFVFLSGDDASDFVGLVVLFWIAMAIPLAVVIWVGARRTTVTLNSVGLAYKGPIGQTWNASWENVEGVRIEQRSALSVLVVDRRQGAPLVSPLNRIDLNPREVADRIRLYAPAGVAVGADTALD